MPQQKFCTNANSLLEEIKTLRSSFESAYHKAISSGNKKDIETARSLKVDLEKKMDASQEDIDKKLAWQRWYLGDGRRPPCGVEKRQNFGKVYEIDTGTNIRIIQAISDKQFVSGDSDGFIRIWTRNNTDGSWVSEDIGKHNIDISTLQVLPDERIVIGDVLGIICIWKKNGKEWESETVGESKKLIETLQVLPDGRIVSGSAGKINVWTLNGANGTWIKEVARYLRGWVNITQALPDGRIVSGNTNGDIQIWSKDARLNEIVGMQDHDHIFALQALPDGRIVSGSAENISIWTLNDTNGTWTNKVVGNPGGWVNVIQVLPDGRIVSGRDDGVIQIWTPNDTEDGIWTNKEIGRHGACINSIQVLSNGQIISASKDGIICVWDGDKVEE